MKAKHFSGEPDRAFRALNVWMEDLPPETELVALHVAHMGAGILIAVVIR